MKSFLSSANEQLLSKKYCLTAELLTQLFNQSLGTEHNTYLIGGADEPEYLPQDGDCKYHRIYFRSDYCASALHEIAHWCVAGDARRLLPDYGYWYEPDGRDAEQQRAFESVEVVPQALEWLFSEACGLGFRISSDNLASSLGPSRAFKLAVVDKVHQYCDRGINPRASRWLDVLQTYFQNTPVLDKSRYSLEKLSL